MSGNIQNIKFWCQKVLPLVYDDSLSYYEVLCKLVTQLNNFIDDYNEFVSEFPDEIEALVAQELDAYVARLIGDFKSFPLTNFGKVMRWTHDAYDRPFRILCIGDSITAGTDGSDPEHEVAYAYSYPGQLDSTLHNFFDANAAEIGQSYNTFTIKANAKNGRQSTWLGEDESRSGILNTDWGTSQSPLIAKPDMIILEIGPADISSWDVPAKPYIPFAQTAGNILEFANWCKENNIDICLMGALPVWARGLAPRNGWGRHILNINLRDLADASGMFFIDIYEPMLALLENTRYGQSDIQGDGAHLSNYQYLAYFVCDQLFGMACRCTKPNVQFHEVYGSRWKMTSSTTITGTTTPTALGRYLRLSNTDTFRAHTYGNMLYQVGVVLGKNKYQGIAKFSFNGTNYNINMFDATKESTATEECVYWFPVGRGTFNVISFNGVDTPSGYTATQGPFATISGIATRPVTTIATQANITELN